MRPRPHTSAKIHLLGGAAALLLMAGCGGGSTTAKQAATPGATSNSGTAYTDCLRKNGVTLPTGRPGGQPSGRPSGRPSGGGGGFRQSMSPESQKALQACASLRPSGGGGGFGGGGAGGADSSAMQAFTACMKTHGVVIPAGRGQSPAAGAPRATPGARGPNGGGGGLRGLQTSDPKVAAALKTCRPLMPTGAPAPAAS